jgi:hypothetical protein
VHTPLPTPEWEVEEINNSKYFHNKLWYHVKWKDYDIGEDDWQPASSLQNAPQLITEFHQKHPDAVGPKLLVRKLRRRISS